MSPARPAVTWGRLLDWTAVNEIPDNAVVTDEYGNGVCSARSEIRRVYLSASADPEYPVLTWERLRALGAEMGCQPGDELWFNGSYWADDVKVVDLGGEGGPADDGLDHLILQRRWG